MSVVANVSLQLDGSQAIAESNKVNSAMQKLQSTGAQTTQKLNSGFGRLGKRLGALRQSFSTLQAGVAAVGLGTFAKSVLEVGVNADRTAKRIENLTGSAEDAAKVQDIAARAAKQFGIGNLSASNAVADLVGRLSPMGVSLSDIETTFIGANKAAASMGLSSQATSNVMLQLSQALGSGVLQGDEFRSISEQMPPILQAVADVMGVERTELKKLGSDGKITTDILIKAMGELRKMETVKPDAIKQFNAAMENLQVTIGQKLLPAITPFITLATSLVNIFTSLPQPIQTVVVGLGGLVAAIAIIGPAVAGFIIGLKALAPAAAVVVGAIGGIMKVLGFAAGLGKVLTAVIAILSGPVGWIAALVAAGIAMYKFRDNIGKALAGIRQGFGTLKNAISRPFQQGIDIIKGAVNGLIGLMERTINGYIKAINVVVSGYNFVAKIFKAPTAPMIQYAVLPRLAEGGFVDSPTNAVIGEGGEGEYVIPESKMQSAMNRYSRGTRGAAVTEGGATDQSVNAKRGGNPVVNISTGPVMRMNNKNYVTVSDLNNAVGSVVAAMSESGSSGYGGSARLS